MKKRLCIECKTKERVDDFFCSLECEAKWVKTYRSVIANSHFSVEGPICPYCLHEHEPDGNQEFYEDNEAFECKSCGELFDMTVDITTKWNTQTRGEKNEIKKRNS